MSRFHINIRRKSLHVHGPFGIVTYITYHSPQLEIHIKVELNYLIILFTGAVITEITAQ